METDAPTNDHLRHAATGAVVVGLDGSAQADEALAWGAEQAAVERRPLTLVHAIDSATEYDTFWREGEPTDRPARVDDVEAEARRMVGEAAQRARAVQPALEVREHVAPGDAGHTLLRAAEHASLVVVGSRGRGPVGSLLLGSVSAAVSRHATCPVVVLRPGAAERRGGVVAGVDGTASSRPVLGFAFREASLRGRSLTVLHTSVEVEDASRVLAEAVARFSEEYPEVEVSRSVRGEQVSDALLSADADASLIVVGRRTGMLAALHHGQATTLLEHAGTAVAVVPATS